MTKPYYQDESVTLYHGDCLDVLPSLEGVDLVVTSPPYNLGAAPWAHLGNWKAGNAAGSGAKAKWRAGYDAGAGASYDAHSDDMPHGEYVLWQREVLTSLFATLSDRGAIFYNHKPRVIGTRVWLPTEILGDELPLRQIVIWARSGGFNYTPSAYVPTHEWLMIIAKEGWRLRDKSASGVGDVWSIPQRPDPDHPAPFPLGIPARAIETSVLPRLVLDPFAGSGTTLRAATTARVPSVGIERSEAYCELIAKRLAQGVLDFGDAS